MPRYAREYSESGIYHIYFRGINKQHIFEENADYAKFLKILENLHNELSAMIYAYCLMDNHVHLVLKEQRCGDISLFMKRLLTKYVMWFNYKYERSGSLIANRYKSKPVEVDEYFLPLVRYVHQNPLEAGIVQSIEAYPWSSYNDYIQNNNTLVDTTLVLDMLDEDFRQFHLQTESEVFVLDGKINPDDSDVRRLIIKKYKVNPTDLQNMDIKRRNKILQELRGQFSMRQLERVTGVPRGLI